MPSGERPGEPFHAAFEVGELTPDGPQLTGLKQGVDPPQAAPQLKPGAARGVSGLEHPARQHGPFGDSVGGAAGQLAGPERVHERDRVPRRSGRGQRVPADLSRPVVLAAVHQRLRVPRGDPGPQTIRKVFPGEGLLADAADLAVPFGYAAGLHDQGRAGQQAPVTPRSARLRTPAAVSCDPGRSPLRCRAAARASSSRERSLAISPSPADSACRYRRTASSNASDCAATPAAASHAATASARSPGSDASTRCRATSVRRRSSCPS